MNSSAAHKVSRLSFHNTNCFLSSYLIVVYVFIFSGRNNSIGKVTKVIRVPGDSRSILKPVLANANDGRKTVSILKSNANTGQQDVVRHPQSVLRPASLESNLELNKNKKSINLWNTHGFQSVLRTLPDLSDGQIPNTSELSYVYKNIYI